MRLRPMVRKLVLGFGMVLALAIAAYFFAMREFQKTFAKMDLTPLEVTAKKAAADLVVVKRPSHEEPFAHGYLDAYQKDPAAFQADAKLFDAWTSAVQIGKETFENTPTGSWVRSTADAGYLSSDHRTDPWNHSLCLLRRGDILAVVSGGPKAPSSPVCRNISVSENELEKLPHGRLLETPAGNLILALDKHSASALPAQ